MIVPVINQIYYHVYTVFRLSVQLLAFTGIGYKWLSKFISLVIFGVFLLPVWVKFGKYYLYSPHIKRALTYGPNPRNTLDIILPSKFQAENKPVAILVWGGAWLIGHGSWSGLLAKILSDEGIVVVMVDYRNFPQGNVNDMMEDIENAISWTIANIEKFGGNPQNITLISQSAGAHLCCNSIFKKGSKPFKLNHLKHVVAVSGIYDLEKNVQFFHNHGLYESLYKNIMANDLQLNSPHHQVKLRCEETTHFKSTLPKITLIHGDQDKSIAHTESEEFWLEMKKNGIDSELVVIEGKSHTDFFLEDLISGRGDGFVSLLLGIIINHERKYTSSIQLDLITMPKFIVNIARILNPF